MSNLKYKRYYIVIVEGMAPVRGEYRVLAEDEEQALQEFERGNHRTERPIQLAPQQIRRKKLSIRDQLTGMIGKIINYP